MTKISNHKYDLEDRTTKYAIQVVNFCKKLTKNYVSVPLVTQLVRSSTSLGANYAEANRAASKKDFMNKIYICKKEAKESKYWIHVIAETHGEYKDECRELWKETHELLMIFSKITKSSKNSKITNEQVFEK
jgi:four helix bundle protein